MEQTGWGRINELVEAARRLPAEEREAFVRAATADEQLRDEVLLLLSGHEDDPWFVDEPSAPPMAAPHPVNHTTPPPRQGAATPQADARPRADGPRPAPPAALVPGSAPRSRSAAPPRPAPAPPPGPARPMPPSSGVPRATTGPAPAPSSGPHPTPPSRERPGDDFDRHPELTPGSCFGPYRIVRQVGRGSMGAVYEATYQAETEQQRVTLRVLPRDWNTAVGADWFRAACHLVAGLDHPWIARLVDGDVAADGTPYVAMEHVAGEEIDAWCGARDLDVPERVKLVLRACTALEYAHQRLVVDRSVSPKNILVTADGQPKLMNCGIARLLFGRPDIGEGLARTGQSLFTPEYASPEQVRGELMTAATDIYSLGVLLYVLLTDHPPYALHDLAPPQMMQVICGREPELPSEVVPRPQRRVLANELDGIVMKALRKDPRTRYLSVTALATDLHAWLDGRPVSVFPGSQWHRAVRTMRRHRLRTAAAAFLGIAVAASAAVFGWQAHALRADRDRAEARLRASRRFSQSLLSDLHDVTGALPGSTMARKTMLGRTVEYMDGLARDTGSDPAVALELADGYRRLAALQAATPGEAPGGRAAAARSLDAAVAAGERALAADPRSLDAAITLVAACGDLAAVRAGLGERDAADRADARHRALVDKLGRDYPRDVRARAAASSAYGRLGAYRRASDDQAGAKVLYAYAVAGFESLAAEGALPSGARRDYAHAQQELGAFLLEDGALDEAERRYTSAQALGKEDLAQQRADASLRHELTASTTGLALVARRRGDNARAESLWTQALATARAALDADAKDTGALDAIAGVHDALAALCRSQRRLDEALNHAREAMRARERLAAGTGAPADAPLLLAVARTAVASIQLDVLEARPAAPADDWRLREAGSLLTQAFPVVRDAPASAPVRQDALAEIDRQTARFRRLAAPRQR
jgi:tetratricopeptide (TPR) repeat protein